MAVLATQTLPSIDFQNRFRLEESQMAQQQMLLSKTNMLAQNTLHSSTASNNEMQGKTIRSLEDPRMAELIEYGKQESSLSALVGRRVSQFDIFLLFIEILKLFIKSREQERISRKIERELQIEHIEKVVSNFKSNGKALFGAYVGAGVLGIFSAAMPLAGHAWGEPMKNMFSHLMPSVQTMKTPKFVKSMTDMTFAMSQMQRYYGEIQNTFSQGNRRLHQHKSDLYKTDGDEDTRSIEAILEAWRSLEKFIYDMLQRNHETTRQLYG